jgi:beta-galactosidase
MKRLTWNSSSYHLDEEPFFLISGEFHYFRVPHEDWEKRLRLFQEAGGNCVATYIPWCLHEPQEGDFRFGDIPQRDLIGFLNLCKRLELHVICRPGPYQYSELRYDGLPQWLLNNYPEILACDSQGNPLNVASISYLHPVFLEKARHWFEVVCPLLVPYTQARNGPIAFVQFDNELMGIHDWYGGWDCNEETMGFGKEDGRFALFLRKRYSNIEILNRFYHTEYFSFANVRPFSGNAVADWERLRLKDYQDFYFSTIAEYAETLINWFDEFGLHCQYLHNSATPTMNAYFRETVEKLGDRFLLGADHYYNLHMDWDQNNPTPKYATKVLYSNEMLRLMGYPPTVCELPGGSPADWPPITPLDLRCCYMLNLALGMKGFNYYIFTGGPNPDQLGANGDSYDYNASVSETGEIRPTYLAQKTFGDFLYAHSWLASSWLKNDYYIGLDWEQCRGEHYAGTGDARGIGNIEAWTFHRKGIVISGLCASYIPQYIDLERPIPQDGKPLFVATSLCMRRSIQENLIRFVEDGGHLILAPSIPALDESFQPCTLLLSYLGNPGVHPCPSPFPRVTIGKLQNIQVDSLFGCTSLPSQAHLIGVEESTGMEVAWRLENASGGSVTWLGLSWIHKKHTHTELMRYLCKKAPTAFCNNPNIWAVVRTDGIHQILFLINLFTSEMSTAVLLSSGERLECSIPAMTVLPIEL